MENLVNMRLFSLLANSSQEVTNEEMQNAYGDFVVQVTALDRFAPNPSEVFRTLNNTRIELVFLQSLDRYGQGKKCA